MTGYLTTFDSQRGGGYEQQWWKFSKLKNLKTSIGKTPAQTQAWPNKLYFMTPSLTSVHNDIWETGTENEFHTDDVSLPRSG